MEFQQALVDRAEFLGAHVAVVDALEAASVGEEGQGVDGRQQARVG